MHTYIRSEYLAARFGAGNKMRRKHACLDHGQMRSSQGRHADKQQATERPRAPSMTPTKSEERFAHENLHGMSR